MIIAQSPSWKKSGRRSDVFRTDYIQLSHLDFDLFMMIDKCLFSNTIKIMKRMRKEGIIKIEMQFMADIFLTCDSCKGSRFKNEILNILQRQFFYLFIFQTITD